MIFSSLEFPNAAKFKIEFSNLTFPKLDSVKFTPINLLFLNSTL